VPTRQWFVIWLLLITVDARLLVYRHDSFHPNIFKLLRVLRSGVPGDSILLQYDTSSKDNLIPKFRSYVKVPSSRTEFLNIYSLQVIVMSYAKQNGFSNFYRGHLVVLWN